jgi:hypothetical protein
VLCRVVVSRHFGKPKVKDAEQDRKLKEFGFSDSDDETPAHGQASAIMTNLSMNCAVHLSLVKKNSLESAHKSSCVPAQYRIFVTGSTNTAGQEAGG